MIRRAIEENPEASNRQLARDLDVDHKTIASVRGEVGNPASLPTEPALVREQGGRLVALVDLVVTRPAPLGATAGPTEIVVAAGFEIPPELRDLPRRAAS
jgi:hypothetical protein